jgi:hypothetical protein
MSKEKMDQIIDEATGRKSLTKAIIIFSIIEALVVVFGILYKSLR